MISDDRPARFLWLPGLKPPVAMTWRQERIFLLVGAAALFAGYDLSVYGLATPQIQASFHIAENQITTIVAYFRVAVLFALVLAASADLVGRRRLLLFTILGQAIATLATAFTVTQSQFVWAQFGTRLFGYAEEMLCFVVIAEEVAARTRGWASGALSALYYIGAGLATLVFAGINFLPFGWRALYATGALPLFAVAYLRRTLPETRRFSGLQKSRVTARDVFVLVKDLVREHPRRIAAILTAVAAFGFSTASAEILSSKYLQSAHGYTPADVTGLFISGGLLGLILTILAGRLSDRVGRKPMAIAIVTITGLCFFFFYSGVTGWPLALFWILSFFGFFSGEALLAGFALEIVPTHYRATVSGLRYLAETLAGAVALILEGVLYDHFHGHGPAVQTLLLALPLAVAAILFLPEPAGKTLEEMTA